MIRVIFLGYLVTLFYTSNVFAQSYVLESTETTHLATDTSAAAGTVWENLFYAVGLDDNNGVVVYYPNGTSTKLLGVSGPIFDADGKWIMAETEDVDRSTDSTILHFGARIDLISEEVFLMQAPDEFPIVNSHFGLDKSGGTSGASGGVGPIFNPTFQCPGMTSAAVINYNDMISRFSLDVLCSTGTLLATYIGSDRSNTRFRKSLVVENIFGSPITREIGVPAVQNLGIGDESLDSIFYRISQNQFDSSYAALIQNSATKGKVPCTLYRGSSGQTIELQIADSCISLTDNFVVFQDADGQCNAMNTDGDRLPLIQRSTGTTYTGCVDADEINDELYVTVDFGGTTSVVQHPISSTNPIQPSACVDTDGDGFGWNGFETCIPDNDEGMTTGNGGFPICASAATDPDGDGFGFENNRSCRVAGASTGTAMTTGNGSFPICASATTDPDGDGFGFENNRSCRVAGTSTGTGMTTGNGGFPICASSATDPDGDGFGFENNRSCIVEASM